jgi:hypothetical protein
MQSEKHFSRRQRALCHRKNGIFENLGGGLATLPPPVPAPLVDRFFIQLVSET